MIKEFTTRLEAIAAEHADRMAAAEAVRPAAEILAAAEDHAANHFSALLGEGRPVAEAMPAAIDELKRHVLHLGATAIKHAAKGGTVATLQCAACDQATAHVVEVDAEGESVATCLCGRFRKFAAGAPVADVPPAPEWYEGLAEEEIEALHAARVAERDAEASA